MVAFLVKDFGGEIPRRDSRNLPDQMAEEAWNCDLASGPLDGLPIPELVKDLSATASAVRRAYRIPSLDSDPDVWLPLPSEYSSVCRSPLANDSYHRYFWTNPPDTGSTLKGAWWNTYARIKAGNTGINAPYNLGFIAPDPGITPTIGAAGGTGTVPEIARSYCFTYINEYGWESSPSNPTAVLDAAPDATWFVGNLPLVAPGSPTGKHFPTVTKMRIYRTLSGASTGAQFYMVADINFGSATYADTIPDTTVVNNVLLNTTSWASPLDELDGLTALPGGMLVGFTGNTVHFCEPDYPHTWPAGYDQSLHYDIVGFGVWQQSLVVLTKGFPSNGQGATPDSFTFQAVQVPEPCIARGSIITDLMGVYYASQNGLVMLNYFGMQNQTLSNLTKNVWLTQFHAANIIACRHRAAYLALTGSGKGFLIDYTEQRMGIVELAAMANATCVWNDVYTGDAYVCDGTAKKIYRWDSPNTGSLTYRWKSKQFYLPAPASLGACQISLDPSVSDEDLADANPLDPGDSTLDLPDGVNAQFKLYAGGHLIHTQNLTEPRMIFRLPSGRKAFNWQFEIVGRVSVHVVELASTMKELKGV